MYVNQTDLYDECPTGQCMTEDFFNYDSNICMENTYSDLVAKFMTVSSLTQSQQEQLGFLPGTENKFKVFAQWIRFYMRIGKDQQSGPYPMNEAPTLTDMCNITKTLLTIITY